MKIVEGDRVRFKRRVADSRLQWDVAGIANITIYFMSIRERELMLRRVNN